MDGHPSDVMVEAPDCGNCSMDEFLANNNKLTSAPMPMLSTSASICGMMGQQEGAAAVNRTIVYGQRKIAYIIFGTTRNG